MLCWEIVHVYYGLTYLHYVRAHTAIYNVPIQIPSKPHSLIPVIRNALNQHPVTVFNTVYITIMSQAHLFISIEAIIIYYGNGGFFVCEKFLPSLCDTKEEVETIYCVGLKTFMNRKCIGHMILCG